MDRNSPPAHTRPLDELEAEITELAGHLNAAQHRWRTLIGEFAGLSPGGSPRKTLLSHFDAAAE